MRPNRTHILIGLLAWGLWAGPAGAQDPDDRLGQARAVAARHLEQLGEGYEARIDTGRHIIYISALDRQHREETIRLVSAYIDAQRRTLLTSPLQWNVTILLPTIEDYRARRPAENVIGFYEPAHQRVTSIDRGSVLIHEFTHALHHADMAESRQVHPPWIAEGLATLFENVQITPAGLVPQLGPRLGLLQRAIRNETAIDLKDLLKMDAKAFMKQANLAYAQSRYLLLYLYEKDRLRTWYKRYKATYNQDPDGIAALQYAMPGRLDQIQKDWQEWVLQQELSAPAHAGEASMGLRLQDSPAGVEVVGVDSDSAAATAGRINNGDIILTFNGQKVTTAMQLAAMIRHAGANRTATLTVKRKGRTLTIRQALGAR